MSISGINGQANPWQWQQAKTGKSDASQGRTTASTGDAIGNPGTPAAGNSLTSFMQALSADLEALLSQTGSNAPAASAGGTGTGARSGETAANSAASGVHHHHHHASDAGSDPSMQGTANSLATGIGQMVQSGTSDSQSVDQSASVFAADIVQALQSYGAVAPAASGTSIMV